MIPGVVQRTNHRRCEDWWNKPLFLNHTNPSMTCSPNRNPWPEKKKRTYNCPVLDHTMNCIVLSRIRDTVGGWQCYNETITIPRDSTPPIQNEKRQEVRIWPKVRLSDTWCTYSHRWSKQNLLQQKFLDSRSTTKRMANWHRNILYLNQLWNLSKYIFLMFGYKYN